MSKGFPSTRPTYRRGAREIGRVMMLALVVLGACSSDPATPASTTTLGTTPAEEASVAKLVLSWCISGTSSASARTQATDAGLTAAQADFAIQQYEAMKASTDKC